LIYAGQAGFNQLRTLSYPGTDIYLFAYACNDRDSLMHLHATWLPEILACRAEHWDDDDEPWIIMVSTKGDSRGDFVTKQDELTEASKIKPCALIETVAKENDRGKSGVS